MISLGLDTETDADKPHPQPLVCVSYAAEGEVGLFNRYDGLALAKTALANPQYEIVGHNLPFDFSVLVAEGLDISLVFKAYSEGRVYDTLIASQMDDIARGIFQGNRKGWYTLDACLLRYCSQELCKDEEIRLRFGQFRDSFSSMPKRFRDYAKGDAGAALLLRNTIHEVPDTRRQAAHAWWLYLMSLVGMPTDEKSVAALAEKSIAESAEYIRQLMPLGWLDVDKKGELHRKVGKVQEYAWAKGVRSPTDARLDRAKAEARAEGRKFRTSEVKATTVKEVSLSWDACEDSGDRNLLAYSKLLASFDTLNKDIEYLREPVVHPRYGLAETGRGTCWKPNLQNLKTAGGIRECFRAPPGWVFAFSDFSGLELSTWAQVCHSLLGQSRLREILNDKVDAHLVIASGLMQISYEEAKERKKNPEDLDLYHNRQVGKAFNFGCMGGGGTDTLKEYAWNNYEVKLTYEEADRARTIWYQTYPEARPYFQLVSRECSEGLPLEHLFSGRLRGGTNFTSRANSRFQGLGGDAAKAAGWAVSEACYVDTKSVLYGAKPCVFVHDELGLMLREETAQEGVKELERLMVSAAKVFIPDVRVSVESVLSRVWSKKAKWKEGDPPWDIS